MCVLYHVCFVTCSLSHVLYYVSFVMCPLYESKLLLDRTQSNNGNNGLLASRISFYQSKHKTGMPETEYTSSRHGSKKSKEEEG